MNYSEISQYIEAPHLYGDVTDEEYATEVLQNNFMTVINGIRYVGVNDQIESLAAKEIVA